MFVTKRCGRSAFLKYGKVYSELALHLMSTSKLFTVYLNDGNLDIFVDNIF